MVAVAISCIVLVVLMLVYISTTKNESVTISSGSSEYVPASNMAKGGANNPGFLIHTDVPWQGKSDSNGCKFENFVTMYYGVRAWYVNLFGKVQNGTIKNTSQMIDVLTPAGKDNPEVARNNYKREVAKATNWLELGVAVFNFEANPDWVNMPSSQKQSYLEQGLASAIQYRYHGNTPQYFAS